MIEFEYEGDSVLNEELASSFTRFAEVISERVDGIEDDLARVQTALADEEHDGSLAVLASFVVTELAPLVVVALVLAVPLVFVARLAVVLAAWAWGIV